MPFRRKHRSKPLRVYVVSDIHGSEGTWRKFLNALRMGVYEADAGLYAGDLAGKAIVPIVRDGDLMTAEVAGRVERARDGDELAALERSLADRGYYTEVVTAAEADRLHADDAAREALFERKIEERVRNWMELADERLGDSGLPIYLVPGNDDELGLDVHLDGWQVCRNVNERVDELAGRPVMGFAYSQPTPWDTPRELPEEQLGERLAGIADQVPDPERAIFMLHVPPHGSGLDEAPLLDENLRPRVTAGDMIRGPVGSKAIRAAIERYRPALGVHGHIHESPGDVRIGPTLCLNPGSEAQSGILRGYLVDLGEDGVERAFRVEA
jgi:Icc-related predicted phosphoesterase